MVMTKALTLDKTQALTLINNFMEKFQEIVNRPNAPKAADLDKLLATSFQLAINEKTDAKNLNDYLSRIMAYQKKFSHVSLSDLLEEPLIMDNKAVVQFEVNLTPRSGKKTIIAVMAIVTIEGNKIIKWTQVSHDKGSSHWDA